MKNPPFVIDYPVPLNDVTVDAKLRSWNIFNILQDAAGRHADILGLGLKQLRESDLSWVLSRIRLQMDEFPGYGETVRVATYPSGFDRLFAYRQFVLTSVETGRQLGVAGSAWLTLNPANYRPVSPAKYLTGLPQWEYDGDIWFQGDTLGKLATPEVELTTPVKQEVSTAFIDYNRHLNNAYYAMFTEDWLGKHTGSLVRMKSIQLNFNQTTAFKEVLCCSGILNDDGSFYVEGVNAASSKNSFKAQGVCEVIPMPQ